MVTPQQTQIFMSIFRGRNDVYAKYWEKNGKSGYSIEAIRQAAETE